MYYNQSIEEVEKDLKTSHHGLKTDEILKRSQKYGKNILPKKEKDSIFKIFFNEFKDPMIVLLLCAIVISFIAGEVVDGFVIIFIVLVDAIVGTVQENKANHSIESLAKLVTSKVRVIRDDKVIEIPTLELTVGDYAMLESGDKISADMRIVEADNFMVDESILTGESIQVHKMSDILKKENVMIAEQSNMVFSGTTVVKGRAKAIVVRIGIHTEVGKIADSLNHSSNEKSPLTIRVEKLSKQISVLILVIAIFITVLLIIKNVPYHEIFLSVIALAISAMPEGLPLALTMALTIASNKMAKKNVIVRKLKSAESLGSCTVIASDKTGTLTVNEQTAKKILLPNGNIYDVDSQFSEGYEYAKEIALLGAINNEAEISFDHYVGDSIDVAFQVLGKKFDIQIDCIQKIEMIPYESENQYSALFYEKDGEVYCTVKGSLEVVQSFCKDIHFDLLKQQNESLAEDGYRVLALANGKIEKKEMYDCHDIQDLTFMGMVGFIDPIRPEVISSLEDCRTAGIQVLMITGDHPLTAFSIAKELGIVSSYEEVADGAMIDQELENGEFSFDQFVCQKRVFARVTPIQKLKIVESLKRLGAFVAVTGDGVNDAPALKAANIGIAMGSGTDIARETADMIILDDNFKSIVTGIKEGRVAYANIRKIILFLISCGVSEVIFFYLSILMDLPMPLVAIQLLWINMVTDGIQDFALSFEKAESGILKEPPRSPKESIFNKDLIREIMMSGIIIGLIVFVVWYVLLNGFSMEVSVARGYIIALMVFIQNVHVFNCRSESRSIFQVPLRNNWLIVIGVILSLLLQVIVMEVPILSRFLQTVSIPLLHLLYLFLISLIVIVIMEVYKKIMKGLVLHGK